MRKSRFFNVANMSSIAICENKTLAKISEFTVVSKQLSSGCLFDFIIYAPVNNVSVISEWYFWVEPVLSRG